MKLTIDLSPELEQYFLQEANQHGVSVEAIALQILTNCMLLKKQQAEAVNLSQRLNAVYADEDSSIDLFSVILQAHSISEK
jgi:plasmid stability protein